jgi:hypothetical protein
MSVNNFSNADNTLTKKRNRLKPRTINNLILGIYWKKSKHLCALPQAGYHSVHAL